MLKTKLIPNTNLQMLCERDFEGELENLERVMKDVKEYCSFRDMLGDVKCFGCIYESRRACLGEVLSDVIRRYRKLIKEKKKEEIKDEE